MTSPIRALLASAMIAIGLSAMAAQASAEVQTTGASGAADATTTIPGNQLPAPQPPFGGVIKNDALTSTPWWAPRIVPPQQAPNVLLIITDDAGFGVPSTFGGVIPTPTMDRVANSGLRYNNIYSTALCSPTRAALITGRNHHSAGFGVISEQSTGFPGYNSIIPEDKATIGRILLDNGYATAWFGKDHNTPAFAASSVGPFDQWPTGLGFEYFYGFVGGDANQWQPNLFRNTTQIYPFDGKPGWNLVTGMADDAIDYLNRLNQTMPSKPFFIKYAPGATHAPHHPTKEWVDKIHAMHLFDGGYNKLREQIFENQKKLGVIAQDTKLEDWPEAILPSWDKLSPEAQKLFIRQVEVFAAYAAYSDHEIGRVIDTIQEMGKLDNTLVIYINGDNGTSAEGGPLGTPNEVAFFNGINEMPVDVQMKWYDVWGTEQTYNHMSAGWAWAFDTPFTWFKQNASRLGGIRQNMAVSWPAAIKDAGGLRQQFMHVIDVVPTILEVTGIPAPHTVDGIKQAPIEGTSFAYTFDKANANAPSRHKIQYFEMMGQWALYDDGWLLSTKVNRAPWEAFGPANPDPLNNQVLQLYDLNTDFSQSHDVAAEHPDKVAELKTLFIQEAKKYEVFPMDASVAARIVAPRPNITAGRTEFTYTHPMVGLPQGDSPSILDASYTFTADITVPEGGANGMIVTSGGRFGGYGFYLKDSKPVFLWNLVDLKRVRWEGPALAPGRHVVEFDFKYDGLGIGTLAFNDMSGLGKGGTGTLKVDGNVVDSETMAHTLPMILQWDESFDIGSDTLTGVNDADYQPPYTLTATLNKLTLKVNRPVMTDADIKKLQNAEATAVDGNPIKHVQPGPQ
ncbi:arylsulfatase [Kaistia hirudinis]|uniref:Arylsulfatase n=2 Tax=Kaistia hirudinis TaxID=1293440 RepID=A0A840AVY5_9HYPH|nr:arylsulfatase [Kaistia hirudinis]